MLGPKPFVLCDTFSFLQGWWVARRSGRKSELLLEGPVQFLAGSSGGWNAKYVPSPCFLTLHCMPLLQDGACPESKSLHAFVSWNMLNSSVFAVS